MPSFLQFTVIPGYVVEVEMVCDEQPLEYEMEEESSTNGDTSKQYDTEISEGISALDLVPPTSMHWHPCTSGVRNMFALSSGDIPARELPAVQQDPTLWTAEEFDRDEDFEDVSVMYQPVGLKDLIDNLPPLEEFEPLGFPTQLPSPLDQTEQQHQELVQSANDMTEERSIGDVEVDMHDQSTPEVTSPHVQTEQQHPDRTTTSANDMTEEQIRFVLDSDLSRSNASFEQYQGIFGPTD